MATANEPSPALTWLSSVDLLIRANRVPITAPMPTSATPRIHGGRPPSIRPVPCSTAEAIIAPNIQLAGNFASRSSSATAMAAADQHGEFERRGDRRRRPPAAPTARSR